MSNKLEKYFYKNKGRMIYKWVHYFDIYDTHFKPFRKKRITVVEFGVLHGGSLQMWKKYFGRRARIIGVDNEPECKQFEEKQIEIFIGDQTDKDFLQKLAEQVGPIDIVIDDGGHTMKQQKTTFKTIWPHVRDGGIYLIEDLHTSYFKLYGGGHKKPGTFIEFAKPLIDQMHAWYASKADRRTLKIDKYTRSIKAIHAYSSIMVFEKAKVTRPYDLQTGKPSNIDFDFLGWPGSKKKKK